MQVASLQAQLEVFMWQSILLSAVISISAFAYEARVVSVTDGDTFKVSHNGSIRKIRVFGIDAPESSQRGGKEATAHMSVLVQGKNVNLQRVTTDRYGREVAIVTIGNQNVSAEMVKNGHAWVYDKFCTKAMCNDWRVSQAHAKKAKTGLWSEAAPIRPDDLRHSNISPKQAQRLDYFVNTNSGKVHKAGCPALDLCTKNCEKLSGGAADASLFIKHNKKSSCGRCHPDKALGV